ncbi:helix-turn-helix domain-containing protein [Streptomyces sp. NBRC 109706]|uniref:helix-turn-helix domain-containing protein n=1 Tax=Streptomyces sp. NBRC 109706 TaxID=1550035 RepID=UPI0007864BC6|nr:helix-turn-helix domain-containing protein [Streptomyces sp. NBRC 109706]
MNAPSAPLTIGELYDQPPLMPVWPTFGRDVLGLSQSGTYKFLAEGRLPVKAFPVGRRHVVRTADVLAWLHLPTNRDGAGVAAPTPSVENDPVRTQS